MILGMSNVFARFVRAVSILDEKGETVAKLLLDEWISIFERMKKLMSDGGTNLVSKAVECLREKLGVGRMQSYSWHPQANGSVEKWNRTVSRDISTFMTSGKPTGASTSV